MEISVIKNDYVISFSYRPHLVEAVKRLPGRKWDDKQKAWTVPVMYRDEVSRFRLQYGFKLIERKEPVKEIAEVEIQIKAIPTGDNLDLSFMKLQPYPFQRQGIAAGIEFERLIIGDQPGLGKAETLYSKIATPNGWVTMGEIKIGDSIFERDGQSGFVTKVYPQGVVPTYRVTMNDDSHVDCNLEHLWNVRDVNRRKRNTGWITKTTGELLNQGLTWTTNAKREASGRMPILKWEIPMCEPVQFKAKEYIIPSYTLGALIGDGALSDGHNQLSLPDAKKGIINRIQSELDGSLSLTTKVFENIVHYDLVNAFDKYHHENVYTGEIRRMGLDLVSGLKFIPEEYLHGDPKQRIALLQGLMDTDGSCIKNRTTFHTTSEKLTRDIKELVESLGGIAIIRPYDRTHEEKGIEYQVNVSTSFCPFTLDYKKDEWKPNVSFRPVRFIQSIEYIGEEEQQCIKVTAEDSLYLTDNYIVTHNTIQSIGIVSYVKAFPCLVICPSSLKENWRREWEMVTGKKAMILTDAVKRNYKLFHEAGLADVFICNYESLKKYFVASIAKEKKWTLKDVYFRKEIEMFQSVIIDELHRCKSTTTHQAKFTKGITTGKRFVIGLTGTPVVNKPKDLVSQLYIINQMNQIFGNYKHFVDTYCAGNNEASNLKELNAKLRNNCFIRREKQAVLTDLPDKQRQVVVCEINNRKEYDDAEKDLIKYLVEYKDASDQKIASALRGEIMVKIGILKNISARGKLADVFDFVDDIMEAGEKLILFIHLKEVAAAVMAKYHGAVSITGSDDMQSRQISVDRFQRDPKVKLIVCSIKAAGVGLTLTASSRVGFIEFPWTFADAEQCEDRAHRIGQKDSVTCYYFLGKNTIDTKIYKIIQAKKAIAEAVTGSTEQIPESVVDMVANLFNQKDNDE